MAATVKQAIWPSPTVSKELSSAMVTINQDGIVPVDAVHPRVMTAHQKVRDFQQAVRASVGTQADRDAIYRQFEGWLHDLKFLTLIAYRYKAQHDFFNRISNPFDDSDQCPVDATDEQKFQYANNLVITAVRVDLEMFHMYTSMLLDRVVRIFPVFFGERNAIKTNRHEKFWKQVKHRPEITYLTPALTTEARWLQSNVDWFRNRVIVHPEGYEAEGYYMRGVKSRQKENLRTFARARVPDEHGGMQEIDKESETLERIVEHLCRYVETVIDVLDQNHAVSVLEGPSRPRPERVV